MDVEYGDEILIPMVVEQQKTTASRVTIGGDEYDLVSTDMPYGFNMTFPVQFQIMDKEIAKKKYLLENRPRYIYTNPSMNADICLDTFELSELSLIDRIDTYQAIIKKMNATNVMLGMQLYEDIPLPIGSFDYITPSLDGNIYMLIFFFDAEEREVYGTFNCPANLRNEWGPYVRKWIQTIRQMVTETVEQEV